MQTTAMPTIIITGITMSDAGKPREAALRSLMPCVSGRISDIFWRADGITSYGSVAPEKINIGKYKMLAITPAILVFGATPPTIMPMLNIDSMTNRYPPRKSLQEPNRENPKNILAAANKRTNDTIEYIV